ncbi:MAG: DUF86 domain-containing protein [Candidatus Sumerlaeota bacterium]|nr:DUF86 domain-containing protein [Candidatus Sumerlaeota bacterium]
MKEDAVYLKHIVDAIVKIEAYAAVGYEKFMKESQWQDAIIRQLEIIGEATKHLSEEIRVQHDYVPWRPIAGLRDVLIHNYMGVDLEAVWQITQKDIPEIKTHIEKILTS